MSDPQVTVYTILSRDRQLLEWCISNARQRAGIDAQYMLIHWINPEMSEYQVENIVDAAKQLDMIYVPMSADHQSDYVNRTGWFLRQLYRGWNAGYEHSHTRYVARLGSDQFFGKDWLAALMRAAEARDGNGVFHSWTVESIAAPRSRHEVRDFGSTVGTFDRAAFDVYADRLINQYSSRFMLEAHECKLFFRHPARGMQCRPDGCTWLQTKALWERFGPMEDTINREGVTGDVAYMDRLYENGIKGYLIPPSVTYHLVRGESREEYK